MSRGTTFRLNEPGMGEYERAGLAGLYLSLTAAAAWESQRQEYPLPESMKERLDTLRETVANLGASGFPLVEDDLGLCLEWSEGGETAALEAIVKWAWQVHDGVLFLPGVHRKREHLDDVHLRAHVHNGMLGTFFQHNKVIKKAKPQPKVVHFDEDKTLSVSWPPVLSDDLPQHGAVPKILKKGVCGDAAVRDMAAWIHPGAALRFKGIERNWCGLARFAYLMLFAPIACHYIRLPSGKKNWDMAHLVPSVGNLREYQREFRRRHMATSANWPFQGRVAGLEDAALHYAARGNARRQSVWSTAVVMGVADYFHKSNKTRKNVLRDIAAGDDADMKKAFRRYDAFNRVFPPGSMLRRSKDDKEGSHYVRLPSCRERITANILRGDPWYADLTRIPFWQRDKIDNDREWFLKLHKYERKHLMTIAEDKEMWDDPAEKEMLDAFREALRRLLNREHAAVRSRGGDRDLHKRWNDTHDKWRRRFSQASTKQLLSKAVHEFLVEASGSPSLKNGEVVEGQRGPIHHLSPAEFRRMVNHPRAWRKVQDLALLALTTFSDKRLARREDGESS